MEIKKESLFAKLIELDLPPDDFAVFGSGPMFVHGLRDKIRDLDLIARGSAWDMACSLISVIDFIGDGYKVVLSDGDIEIFDSWGPGNWNVDELIDTAEVIDGIKFVTLENVLKWKRLLRRDKDIDDIKKIEEYLDRPH